MSSVNYPPSIIPASPPFSVPVGEAKPNETAPHRNTVFKDKLLETPDDAFHTTYELLKWCANKHGDRDCMGYRDVIRVHKENKKLTKMVDGKQVETTKEWQFFELSSYRYLSFKQVLEEAEILGSGLVHLGFTPNHRLHLYASTSRQWMLTASGAGSQSIPIVTAYDSLGEEAVCHSFIQTASYGVFTDSALFPTLRKAFKEAKDLKYVIYKDPPENDAILKELQELRSDIKFISHAELRELGLLHRIPVNPPTPDSTACIMYTSGSTGVPKGVVLSQRNVIAAVAGASLAINGRRQIVGPNDYLLAYLPLAHILEFVFEHVCFYWGGTIGYGTVRTISDASVRNCKGDIREFRPTVLVGVGAVWETIRKGIITKVHDQGFLVRNIFWGAYYTKNVMKSLHLMGTTIIDSLIFKKVREATGGRLRVIMVGGSSISFATQYFLSRVLAPMVVGYGLTETSAMCTLMSPDELCFNSAGAPVPSVEIKLVSVPDAGYSTNEKIPKGEVYVRGPAVCKQYYKDEKETKEAFTDDGWFKTGDIGAFLPNGHLRLIDRRKNLVKTQNGEYIALEKVEAIYRSCQLVGNIMVYADQEKVKPVAVVVPVEKELEKVANKHGVSHSHMYTDKRVRDHVLKELLDVGKRGGLQGIELLCGVVLDEEEWTPESGFVTAAQKLQRRNIYKANKKAIDKAYEESSS